MVLLELIDAYYDPHARRVFSLTDRPETAEIEQIAITLAEARRVFEGCFLDRALHLCGHPTILGPENQLLWPGHPPERRRALTRHDPALLRSMRRVTRLHPDVVKMLLVGTGQRRPCTPRVQVLAAARRNLEGNAAAQFRAIAESIGRIGTARWDINVA